MNWTINQTVDLSRGYTPVVWPDALMVSGDVGAHTWRLTVLDNGVPADLSGATITGSFLRADGNTVLVSGTVSGNIASVTLTDVCYAVEGKMKGTIKMTKSGAVITLAAVIFMVSLFTSGSVIDPGVAYADFNIDASPKGVYANIAALISADPDHTKIYITLDDGKWCYHNGTTWVAGGTYQAVPIGGYKGDLIKSAIIENGYYYGDTGLKNASAALKYSKIEVVPGQIVAVFGDFTGVNGMGVALDAGGGFIQKLDAPGGYSADFSPNYRIFLAPATAAHLCVTMLIDKEYYALSTTSYTKPGNIDSDWLSGDVMRKTDDCFSVDLLEDAINVGVYYSYSSSGFQYSAALNSTLPIDVSKFSTLSLENFSSAGGFSSCGVFFNSSWATISNASVGSADTSAIVTVPAEAKYFMPIFETAQIGTVKLYGYAASPEKRIAKSAIYPPIGAGAGLYGKKWVSFGDSIVFLNSWQPYLINKYALNHTNCGIGSTALAGTGANAFHQAVRLNAVMAADPDIVTILGGANDLGDIDITIGTEAEFLKALASKDTTTFIGAYSKIIETLLAWKPTLRIIILGTTWAHGDGVDVRAAGSSLTYTDFSDASKLVAQYYGLPFADLHGECGFNAFTMGDSPNNIYSSDNIHPNAAGGKRIAEVVDKAMTLMFAHD